MIDRGYFLNSIISLGVQDNISHSVSNVAVVMFLLCFKLKCYIVKIKIIHKLGIQIAKKFLKNIKLFPDPACLIYR